MEGLLRKVLGIKHKNGHKLIAVCKTNGHGTLDIDIQGESSEREKGKKENNTSRHTLDKASNKVIWFPHHIFGLALEFTSSPLL